MIFVGVLSLDKPTNVWLFDIVHHIPVGGDDCSGSGGFICGVGGGGVWVVVLVVVVFFVVVENWC